MAEKKIQQQQQQQQPQGASKIDALYSWLSYDLQRIKGELLKELQYSSVQVGSLYQELKNDQAASARAITQEIRFGYKQNQNIYDGLSTMITEKLGDTSAEKSEEKEETFSAIDQIVALQEKLEAVSQQLNALEKIEAAIANISAGAVDYTRISEEVGDKMLEVLGGLKDAQNSALAKITIDYDRIIYGAAEKVVESLPYPEKVDYRRITDIVNNAANAAVEKAMEKVSAPAEIDYERLADLVVAKMSANTEQNCEIMLDEDGIEQIAEKVCEKLATEEESTYDLVIDQEGIDAIAKSVSERICATCVATEEIVATEAVAEDAPVEVVEESVEETSAEEPTQEETIEEIVEEPVAEVTEEVTEVVEAVEEQPTQQPVEDQSEESLKEEIAASLAAEYQEIDNQLVDAETGLVIRLKKSFTAKMKQSEERIKEYYSDLKNELTSYKKINSNVSWHGDRFNYGRDTVAKINILGKTLCFYIALDPNDPEYKTTVYHQKDVGNQKAYESTPFMVKIKSDAAAKKALRLVGYLAEKIGTEKEESFETVDYVEQFGYQSTKQLFEDGFIKATKEKKVDLDF